MANSFPVLGSTTHVQSVTYDCTFSQTSVNAGAVIFQVPQPVKFMFSFETGRTQPDPAVDLFNITTDYTWFDQAAEETAIRTALNSICTTIATLLPGATQASIQATVRVQRTWRVNPNQAGTAAPVQMPGAPVTYAEQMAYP